MEIRVTQGEIEHGNGSGDRTSDRDGDLWRARTRLVLTPTAPPSILGLFGFAASTFIVAALLAKWYGGPTSPVYLFPFALFFGGVAQLAAGLFAYRARDGLATAMHGMWGSFWLAYGLLWILVATGAITVPAGASFPELGFWFIPLAITWFGAAAALAVSRALVAVLVLLAAGSTLAAIGYIAGVSGVITAAGYVLVASSLAAFYTAGAMMLEGTFRHEVLPLGKVHRARQREGGLDVIEYPVGMPGAHAGQ
jgi:hypothetical protein